jgi:hypothetical protein
MNSFKNDVNAGAAPATNKALMFVAGVFLAIPNVGLLWVGSYAKVEPTLAGFPFFIWYQFLWVFLCAACTFAAYRTVLIARPRRPLSTSAGKSREARR